MPARGIFGGGNIPAGLGAIADLEALHTLGVGLELAFTSQPNGVTDYAQIWEEGTNNKGDYLALPTVFDADDAKIFNAHVFQRNSAGKRGPSSNIVRFSAFRSAAVLKDVKFFTYVGAGTGIPSLNLDSMDGGAALDRAADDIIVVGCSARGGSAVNVTQEALAPGFEECHFISSNASGHTSTRSAWKPLADGTETTVDLVVSGSGTNIRVNYFAASFSIVGVASLGETLATAEVTSGNPAAQTIHTAETGDTRIAIAWKGGSTSNPAWDFSGYSPLFDRVYSNTPTVQLDSRLQIAILPPSAPLVNIVSDMNDHGNNSFQTFYIVVRPA